MRQFDHERLDVYRLSVDFVVLADEVIENFPRGRAHLGDQLHRAATSITLNIAEGAGEFATAEKLRFYRMARRSATECAAVLEVCARLKIVEPDRYSQAREQLLNIVAMLVRLSRTGVTGKGTGKGTGTGKAPFSAAEEG